MEDWGDFRMALGHDWEILELLVTNLREAAVYNDNVRVASRNSLACKKKYTLMNGKREYPSFPWI